MTGGRADQWGPWDPTTTVEERDARRRELRALALLFCGAGHPLTRALTAKRPEALADALSEIERLPALRRRRLLSMYAALRELS